MTAEPRQEISDFLEKSFPGLALADDDDIFALGVVNSLFTIQLIMFIEKTFALKIPNEDLELDNFRSITAMSHLVGRLTGTDTHA